MMMKRRKKRNVVCDTFKPFGNPGRKLRTNVITSAPPMAIADRAPGICSVFSVCIIYYVFVRSYWSLWGEFICFRTKEVNNNLVKTRKRRRYFSSLVTGYV